MLFGKPNRPEVCSSLQPSPEMGGTSTAEAFAILIQLETQTTPAN
jgi:hypothetical protein